MLLAAGEGRRLRPLTEHLPKALCPVGNVALLDRALARVAGLGLTGPHDVAVNACHLADQVVRRVGARARLSVEPGPPLGTAGGLARLRDWTADRGVLVGNADGYLADPARPPGADIAALLDGWDGRTVRLLGVPVPDPDDPGEFSGHRFAGFSLLPARYVHRLPADEPNLVRAVWRPAEAAGELEIVPFAGTYLDTGTPADYLAANLHAAGGANLIDPTATVTGACAQAVVGPSAVVHGTVERAVVWPGELVDPAERLRSAVRFGGGRTLPVATRTGRRPAGTA
ncbi:sugar phosphate nucleotidyltransferase [Plantactinospora sp. KBS50]|uniref:nucleotidyltransferase family protein n=1 Tax=Plantactinospora sp. KBS50 TaxID=2024580 RepID=UPI000BAB0277|nr:sugar phosphate nucleotidyltransferase [Plantactinospora sp. KBS50]ASW57874.1 nucleotidyl transferase [Plantactinospora sp. KBS50]